LEEKHRRSRVCPIAEYTPNPGGQTAIGEIADKFPVVMFLAGNRSGKTHWLVQEIIASLLGYRPHLVPDFCLTEVGGELRFPSRDQVPSSAWVLRTDGLPIRYPSRLLFITGLPLTKGIGQVLMPKWKELWPPQVKFQHYTGPMGTWTKIEAGGSEIIVAADTQAVGSFEGANYDRIFTDEPIRKNVFIAAKRGLIDMRGSFLWSMTPLGDSKMAWLAHDIILNKERNDVGIVYGRAKDNAHIDQEALDNFLNDPTMSKDERAARECGTVGAIGKRIISTYDSATALIPPTDIPYDVPRLLVVDPHHSKPPCLVWIALMGPEHWIVYREWPERPINALGIPKIDMEGLAGMIKSKEGKENVVYRICDPNFGRQHGKILGTRFRSFQDEMGDYELHFDAHVDNSLEPGIQALRDAFTVSPLLKRPKIQIFNTLRNVPAAMNLWSYTEQPDGGLKPSESFKDFADCIRYTCMFSPASSEVNTEGMGVHSYIVEDED
jgi:hypothetical protein